MRKISVQHYVKIEYFKILFTKTLKFQCFFYLNTILYWFFVPLINVKSNLMKNVFICLFAGAVLASCTATSSTSKVGKAQPSIANSQWVLAESVKGKTPTLNLENGKLTGNAGCNNYFGEVVLNPSSGGFTAGKMGSTKMFCDNMSVEDNFLKVLSEANRYVVSGTTLELYKDGLLLMKLNKSN